MTTKAPVAQPQLERPVCGGGCVLLANHPGKHIASNGKAWR